MSDWFSRKTGSWNWVSQTGEIRCLTGLEGKLYRETGFRRDGEIRCLIGLIRKAGSWNWVL